MQQLVMSRAHRVPGHAKVLSTLVVAAQMKGVSLCPKQANGCRLSGSSCGTEEFFLVQNPAQTPPPVSGPNQPE